MDFEFPSDAHFTCQQCGDCCRTWNVLVTDAEREELKSLDWSDKEAQLGDVRPTVAVKIPGMEGRHRLNRTDDGACVFLVDNRCALHTHFGAESKPLMCRLYPFAFYELGERTTVDCSFFCKGVNRDLGDSLEGRESEWVRLLNEGQALGRGQHELRPGVPIDADLMWELEHYLLDFLADDSLTIDERVRCCVDFSRLGTTGDPTLPTAKTLRDAMATGLPVRVKKNAPQELDENQRGFFYQWVYLALNPPPASLYEQGVEQQRMAQSARKEQAERYKNENNRPWVDGRELEKSFAQVAAVSLDVSGEASALLRRYLQAKVIGQRFLMAGERVLPLVQAVPRFFISLPVALWTAKALAAERDRDTVELLDLQDALRWVDRTAGQMAVPRLTEKQQKAWNYLLYESSLVEAATAHLLE